MLGLQSKAPAVPKCLDPSREKAVHASVRAQRKSTENWVKPWEIVHETIVIDEDTILANHCTMKKRKKKVGSTQAQRCGMAQKNAETAGTWT